MKYSHVFFDLDRTLWDFERNSKSALLELHKQFEFDQLGIHDFEAFLSKYRIINDHCWFAYIKGSMQKEELRWIRFYNTLIQYGIDDKLLATRFGEAYVQLAPTKTHLIEGALELLEQLHTRCKLVIITNGFSEAQAVKLKSSGLDKYFETVICSDAVGFKKPTKEIFQYAFAQAQVSDLSKCVMIGDDFHADIQGAKASGIEAIWLSSVNHNSHQPTIQKLSELNELLAL